MAIIQSHADAAPARFFDGGEITIKAATDDYVVRNIVPNSLRMRDGREAVILDTVQGALQAPRRGDPQASEIEFSVKSTHVMAGNLLALMGAVASGSSVLVEYTVEVRVPDHLGAAAGVSYTYTRCYFDPAAGQLQTGATEDTVQVRLMSRDSRAAIARYS